ncbi:hypothetical protein RND81_10G165700 [Saponaria officinalis]|uniref:Uncharacterized protein n=1 Tax=Saponaria officinalis TaxID=3572 RepID=A0AAW1I5G3_SAPOF
MVDNLFDIYCKTKTVKGIWDALETKYRSDVFGTKKYTIARWLKFEIVDGKPIMDQIHDYENLVFEILGEGMILCEFMQANAFIEKLASPSWDKYKKHHKKKDTKLRELIGYITIEDVTRSQDHVKTNATNAVKDNVVEYRNTGTNKRIYDQYNKPKANVVEGSSEGDDIITAMVSEINLVGNLEEWIVDTAATRHICT